MFQSSSTWAAVQASSDVSAPAATASAISAEPVSVVITCTAPSRHGFSGIAWRAAATAAAGQVNGAQDTLPVVYQGSTYGNAGAMEDRVLAHVRTGDLTVLAGLPLNTLDESTQRAVAE